MMRHKFIHAPFYFQNFAGVNFNIRRLALIAAQRLVDHDARVRQAETFAFRPGSQQKRPHRGRLSHTNGADVWLNKLHGVIDGHPRSNYAARRINVQIDIFFRVFRFQEQHLRHDQVSHMVFDLAGQKYDAFLK
ncbi:Uncharacterised protein [Salmonella enterica subsp. enterica serovar Typhi]|nr:Uncharacterised protein [Salmonella enterica subsp. enterica serovar Typhi]